MMIEESASEREFDFWLGRWDVSWDDDQHGTNRVERILDGKVIQENFDGSPALDFQGKSWSVYDKKTGLWRQTWVDSEGNYWAFKGGIKDGRMILATEDVVEGKKVLLRMVFFNITENELDWHWERSEDGGKSWLLRWHIHYRRRDET